MSSDQIGVQSFWITSLACGHLAPEILTLWCKGRWECLKLLVKLIEQGALYCQPKQCTIIREIPQNYPTFALFDPPKIGNLMTHVESCYTSPNLEGVLTTRKHASRFCFRRLYIDVDQKSENTKPFQKNINFWKCMAKGFKRVIRQ